MWDCASLSHLMMYAQEGRGGAGLGLLLLTFLERYGERFQYGEQAVAVGEGGVVRIASLAAASQQPPEPHRHGTRVFVEDPLTKRCAPI